MVTKLASYSAMWNGYFSCLKWVPEFAILWLITPTNFFFNFLISLFFSFFLFLVCHASVHFSEGFSLSQTKVQVSLLCLIQLCTRNEMYFTARSHNCEKRLSASSGLSISLSAWNISAPTQWSFMKFDVLSIFWKICREKIKVFWKPYKNNGSVTWKPPTFMISSRILLTVRNVSDKSCRENQNTHFVSNNFFLKSCRLWDNVKKKIAVEAGRRQMAI